jgi:hypothetical protein
MLWDSHAPKPLRALSDPDLCHHLEVRTIPNSLLWVTLIKGPETAHQSCSNFFPLNLQCTFSCSPHFLPQIPFLFPGLTSTSKLQIHPYCICQDFLNHADPLGVYGLKSTQLILISRQEHLEFCPNQAPNWHLRGQSSLPWHHLYVEVAQAEERETGQENVVPSATHSKQLSLARLNEDSQSSSVH